MNSDLLVIFENEEVFPDALTYAREFAIRSDARVTFLMLVAMSFAASDHLGAKRNALRKVEASSGKLLAEFCEIFIRRGLETSSVLKIGDSAHELLKFLADRPPFKAIIWGSSADIPKGIGARGHWLRRVAVNLECPLLTITRKKTGK